MALNHKDIVLPEIPCDGDLELQMFRSSGAVLTMEDTFGEDISKNFWQNIQNNRISEWATIVADYETNPDDVHNAWHYLDNHPAFWIFDRLATQAMPIAERIHERHLTPEYGIHRCVDITVTKVNIETRSTEDEGPSETEIWIELGNQSWPEDPSSDPNKCDRKYHDTMLDCGGPTLDAAIITAARNVWEVYGNDRRVCDAPYDERNYSAVRHASEEEDDD